MDKSAAAYRKYCALSKRNGSNPVRYIDAFELNEQPVGTHISEFVEAEFHVAARATFKSVQVSGKGSLTLIGGFSSTIENVRINIQAGSLFLFIGPFCEIKDLTIGSFNLENYLHFGAGTTINTGNFLIQGENTGIFFGHDCMFSTQCHARTSDSHSMFSYQTRQRINRDQSIRVGDHVWIGRHVMINKGAHVADDVILGQGSIVSGKVSGSSCYAGVPARCLKEQVTWERDRIECLDDINKTYNYRPRQLAINRFLSEDFAFHPRAKDLNDAIRMAHFVFKEYPWIPAFSFNDRSD